MKPLSIARKSGLGLTVLVAAIAGLLIYDADYLFGAIFAVLAIGFFVISFLGEDSWEGGQRDEL